MPPKKKPAAQTISKPDLPEAETTPSDPKKIPRSKSHFRYLHYDYLKRARHIRVKLWKSYACDLSPSKPSYSMSFRPDEIEKKRKFEQTLKRPTIKKSLKFTKKFKFNSFFLSNNRYLLQQCKSWKLDTLKISASSQSHPQKLLKPFMNSKLKECVVIPQKVSPAFISSFRRFRNCSLWIQRSLYNLKMLINTNELLHRCKQSQSLAKMEKQVSNQIITIAPPNSFESISYDCADHLEWGYNQVPDLPPLPNLKTLRFSWTNSSKEEIISDISFVGQYSKLQSLSIKLQKRQTETLDFLTQLPFLKEFSFSSAILNGNLRKLPSLKKLEKLSLRLIQAEVFTMDDIRDFISKNKALKSLSLGLSIQSIGNIFECENDNLLLPSVENLQLNLLRCERPYAGAAKTIAQTLRKFNSLKQLSMEIEHNSADLNVILLKQGIASVKSLEELTLKYRMTGGLEDNKLKPLKDVFMSLENLKSLELDLNSDNLSSGELSSILDGLSQLKNLEKLKLTAKLIKCTQAASNKLGKFLVSLRHLKVLRFTFRGIPGQDARIIRQSLLPSSYPLSLDTYSFIFLM